MLRKLSLSFVLLLSSLLSIAQTTTVTATVLDPNGVRYSGGTVSAQMALASPAPTPLPALTNVSGTLDASGAFSIVLTASQSYSFTVCAPAPSIGPRGNSVASGVCFAVSGVAISGSTQDLTSTLNTSAATLGGFNGMDFLGSTTCAATCATTSTLTIPARDVIFIVAKVTAYGGSDIISLRFNGDSSTNYWDRHITFATGGATGSDVPNVSTTLIRLAGNAVTVGRIFNVTCMNSLNRSKACQINVQTLTGAAGTAGILDIGAGEWVNTTAQITSITALTASGNNMGAGTGFAVFGKNF